VEIHILTLTSTRQNWSVSYTFPFNPRKDPLLTTEHESGWVSKPVLIGWKIQKSFEHSDKTNKYIIMYLINISLLLNVWATIVFFSIEVNVEE
jgi:hypothetical protein